VTENTWLLGVLKVAAGGSIVQAAMAYHRSRQETRKIEQETFKINQERESVTIQNMEQVMLRMDKQLKAADATIATLRENTVNCARRTKILADRIAALEAENATLQAHAALRTTDDRRSS
jgi:hypothetical protein